MYALARGADDRQVQSPQLRQLLARPSTPREWVVSYFRGRDRGANQNARFYWIGNRQWKLDHTGKAFHVAMDPMESKPIRQPEDTPKSTAAREKFNAALKRLGVDCSNLWVYANANSGRPAGRGKRKVKIYGKAKGGG